MCSIAASCMSSNSWEVSMIICLMVTDDQSRATKQEQANLCAVTVLCAST